MNELTQLFTNIANSIRAKTGGTAAIQANNFATAIANIPTGTPVYFGVTAPTDGSHLSVQPGCSRVVGYLSNDASQKFSIGSNYILGFSAGLAHSGGIVNKASGEYRITVSPTAFSVNKSTGVVSVTDNPSTGSIGSFHGAFKYAWVAW